MTVPSIERALISFPAALSGSLHAQVTASVSDLNGNQYDCPFAFSIGIDVKGIDGLTTECVVGAVSAETGIGT